MNYPAANRIKPGCSGKAGHFNVAEAMVGKAWFPDFGGTVAPQNVMIFSSGRAEVFLIDEAVVVEKLGEAQADICSGRTAHPELGPAAQVLTEVKNINAGRRIGHGERNNGLNYLNGRHHLRGENPTGRFNSGGRVPAAGGRRSKIRSVPARLLKAGIVGFTVIDAVFKDGAAGGLPGSVRMNFSHIAAGVFNIKLKYQGPRFIPALAKHDANGIFALPEKAGYIVGYIENSFLVVGPARVKHMIADASAV